MSDSLLRKDFFPQTAEKLWLYWLLVALLIMFMPLSEQARGRPTWSMRATWSPRAPCWWPLV